MKALGLDPSLNSTGYAYYCDGEYRTGVVQPWGKVRGLERLDQVCRRVAVLLDQFQPDIIAYEGYAFGKQKMNNAYLLDRAELGGLLKREVYIRKIPLLVVPPTSLKLYATGKGNADKDEVVRALEEQSGLRFKFNDEADAYALVRMAMAKADARLGPRDPRHYKHAAIRGCEMVYSGH